VKIFEKSCQARSQKKVIWFVHLNLVSGSVLRLPPRPYCQASASVTTPRTARYAPLLRRRRAPLGSRQMRVKVFQFPFRYWESETGRQGPQVLVPGHAALVGANAPGLWLRLTKSASRSASHAGLWGPRRAAHLHVARERQNLTMRMCIRRLTRLTNGFSKKWENLKAALALHFAYYSFCRVRKTPRMTPAMAAGLTARLLGLAELLAV
jgi:hypothetical protein